MSDIKWQKDAEGIVILTLDAEGASANTLTEGFERALTATVQRLATERESITGVILTSAKKTFFAGADLNRFLSFTSAEVPALSAELNQMKADLRTLETLGVPVVAAINGAALGGGYEIALACHHRVALEVRGSEIGLPEVTLGLLPAAGGVTRTVRMFGIQKALTDVLLQGQRYKPAKALAVGLVDELAQTPEELMAKARAWIKVNPAAQQPWDVKGYRIPGGTPSTPAFAANLPAFPANLRKQLKGQPMPAPRAILATVIEGTQVDIDGAFKIETRYLMELVTGPVTRNMIQAFFFDLQSITRGGSRPKGYPVTEFQKSVVLGAGMMGAGIAYVQAMAGMQVILKDRSLEAAEKGKAYSQGLLDKAVAKGRMSPEKRNEILARIVPTANDEDCAGADLVVEAVFEDTELKKAVFASIEKRVRPDALLASNTSTLPITHLATGVQRQEDFIGLHFFSPVDKMPLVEIVVGDKTSDATLAKAIDYVLAIKKTPIVVNDSQGFFTSRVMAGFLFEAVAMLNEGVSPVSIEQAGTQAGFPAGPLQVLDELTVSLALKILMLMKTAFADKGKTFTGVEAEPVLTRVVNQYQRSGRSTGGGFYDYDAKGKRIGLWPGLKDAFNSGSREIPFEDMKERMLVLMAVETIRCFDEGVLRTVPDANIGSIFGIGYPAWTGGVIQYINQYPGGLPGFAARATELAGRYGARFTPPPSLVARAAEGKAYA
ncbi:3-hydroxyacyl-CoA dehydrogenase [Solimonas sp. K1W22B-7]|uniref:3-hydroxyacyl-CoA dehydrogenase NAD-binding domain-containing protein n=1 Tax=Solimonas sp. K1W22B-7 TaxID=2303331 RepID=UPI000E3363DD|nr:3-hydroxyacyl-CoA dehydrogenase NAD-binding domain-containing protein [Solimonas sp. K1W22B-7]AXQ31134.1 3-hydroxyacyl-CoA dehydrogenase [Solimonas sp. K1W22B-7]